MRNLRISSIVRIGVIGLVVLILGGLVGWYFYLHGQQQSLSTFNQQSGLIGPAPTFGGSTGSTETNQAIAAGAFGAQPQAAASNSQLWEVDPSPVAGMGFVDTPTDEYLYYAERGNGYVFSAHPSDETSVRLTDTLLPKIYQALFAQDGSVIERSIDGSGNVTTFLAEVSTSTSVAPQNNVQALQDAAAATSSAPGQLIGTYLQTGISQIAMDPVSKALFYLVPSAQGGVVGYTEQWNGTKQTQVFSSIVGSWLPYYLSDGTVAVLESPADGIPGYAYRVSATGALTPLVREVDGLTILPKVSSPYIVYSASSGTGVALFAATSSTPTQLPIATIADKCVWLPGQSEIIYCAVPNGAIPQDFLDNWYKGMADTSDDWWEIDLTTGNAQRIYSPSAANRTLDVEDPVIDPTGSYIAFVNATDQSLWVLRVTQ